MTEIRFNNKIPFWIHINRDVTSSSQITERHVGPSLKFNKAADFRDLFLTGQLVSAILLIIIIIEKKCDSDYCDKSLSQIVCSDKSFASVYIKGGRADSSRQVSVAFICKTCHG